MGSLPEHGSTLYGSRPSAVKIGIDFANIVLQKPIIAKSVQISPKSTALKLLTLQEDDHEDQSTEIIMTNKIEC